MRLSCRLLTVDRPGRSRCFRAVVQTSHLERFVPAAISVWHVASYRGGHVCRAHCFWRVPWEQVLPSYSALLPASPVDFTYIDKSGHSDVLLSCSSSLRSSYVALGFY